MKHNKDVYLYDLKTSCENIFAFVGNMSAVEYGINLMAKRAVEREFEIIGEILKRLRDEFPDLFAKIPDAPQIIGFRNVLSHGYDSVSDDRVHEIVKNDLPKLYKALGQF